MKITIRTLDQASKYNKKLGETIELPEPVRKVKKKKQSEEDLND